MPEYLSARKSAEYCGVNERTVRNWIASGRLPAERDARGFRIRSADLEALRTADSAPSAAASPHPPADSADSSAQLLALVAQLHRENVELAGRLGFYQARVQELEGRVKLLSSGTPEVVANLPQGAKPENPPPAWQFWRRVRIPARAV